MTMRMSMISYLCSVVRESFTKEMPRARNETQLRVKSLCHWEGCRQRKHKILLGNRKVPL